MSPRGGILTATIALAALAACHHGGGTHAGGSHARASSPAPDAGPDGAPEVVAMGYDELVRVGELALRIVDLEDSRCPIGVECVWEGEAVATVETARDGGAAERVELTLRPGREPEAVAAAGHRLRLLGLEPHPREGTKIEPEEIVASIEVSPAAAGGARESR